MKLNLRRLIADVIVMFLTVLLTPVYLIIYFIYAVKRCFDFSKPITSEHVLITGATSGLGECLAHIYAKTCRSLILVGRNQEKLDIVKSDCCKINSSCSVETLVADLSKPDEFRKIMEDCSEKEQV